MQLKSKSFFDLTDVTMYVVMPDMAAPRPIFTKESNTSTRVVIAQHQKYQNNKPLFFRS
jgi:hypothetical protein